MRTMKCLCLGLLLPSVVAAQTVVAVPSGANIDTYITAAQPGSILVLAPGTYYGMNLNKGVVVVGYGATISGVWSASIPGNQKAGVLGLTTLGTYPPIGGGAAVTLQGDIALSDLVFQNFAAIWVTGGLVTMQRITAGQTGLTVQGGTCMIANSLFGGHDAWANYQYGASGGQPGLSQSGGMVMVTNSTIRGGNSGWDPGPGGGAPGSPLAAASAWLKTGGVGFAANCTLVGGNGASGVINGRAAIAANGTLSLARSTLTDGTPTGGASGGYQLDPRLVGLSIDTQPRRGNPFTVTVTAGSSLETVALLGGFSRGISTTAPFAQPLFGNPAELFPLLLFQPIAGWPVSLSCTFTVPNLSTLQGAEVWFQTLQLAGDTIETSPVVGGSIR